MARSGRVADPGSAAGISFAIEGAVAVATFSSWDRMRRPDGVSRCLLGGASMPGQAATASGISRQAEMGKEPKIP